MCFVPFPVALAMGRCPARELDQFSHSLYYDKEHSWHNRWEDGFLVGDLPRGDETGTETKTEGTRNISAGNTGRDHDDFVLRKIPTEPPPNISIAVPSSRCPSG